MRVVTSGNGKLHMVLRMTDNNKSWITACGKTLGGFATDSQPEDVTCEQCRHSTPWRRHAGDLRPNARSVPMLGKQLRRRRRLKGT